MVNRSCEPFPQGFRILSDYTGLKYLSISNDIKLFPGQGKSQPEKGPRKWGSPVRNSSQISRCEMATGKEEVMPFALQSDVSRETEDQMHLTQWEWAWSSDPAAVLVNTELNAPPFLHLGEIAPKILIFLLKKYNGKLIFHVRIFHTSSLRRMSNILCWAL